MRDLGSEHYVDQLLVTDPELVSAVDAGMARIGYRRIDLSSLDPQMAEAITLRDKPFVKPDFRPESERLVYTDGKSVTQVRRYGCKASSYWTDRWGALIIHVTHVPRIDDFDSAEIGQLMLSQDILSQAIEPKRKELGIDFKAVVYPRKGCNEVDPCSYLPCAFDNGILTNQQFWVNRESNTDLVGEEKAKVIRALSAMLPYLTDVTARYAMANATRVRAVRATLKEFNEAVSFVPVSESG